MKMLKRVMFGIALLAATPSMADDMRREVVRFAPGSSSSTQKATVKGNQTIQYSLSVNTGQKMRVRLNSKNTSLYFNVTASGPKRRYTIARSAATQPAS